MNWQIISLGATLLSACALGYARSVEPMVKACFDQEAPFNNMCPHSSAAGCGPVAVAQILSFYRQPAHGAGTVSYVNSKSGETISENLGEFYFDWSRILDRYTTGSYTEAQAMAVARLVYACGVAMNVSYGSSTSTGNKHLMVYNLQHHLYMSPESRYLNREYYSTPEWIEILNSQLAEGHPVFYRGTTHYNNQEIGHMFVIDGVNDAGLYHANWGHGGDGDKFTDLNVLNQGVADGLPGGKNVCYNFKQAMMINCYPVDDLSATPLQWCEMTEPITLNDDALVNKIVVKTGQDFKLGTKITSCAAETSSVSYKWALMRDGEEVKSMASGSWSTFAPYHVGTIGKRVSVPASVPDGDYTMLLMTKSDIAPDWQPVRDNPVNRVDISVRGSSVTVTVPDQHKGDPELYMSDNAALTYNTSSGCLEILCDLINPTDNNFEGKFRIEVQTDNSTSVYEPDVCIYGDTNVKYRFSVPKSVYDPAIGSVKNVDIRYMYDEQEIVLGTTRPNGISDLTMDKDQDIYIYTLQGACIAIVKRGEIQTAYNDILSSLPKGVYIIKEGSHTRKIMK